METADQKNIEPDPLLASGLVQELVQGSASSVQEVVENSQGSNGVSQTLTPQMEEAMKKIVNERMSEKETKMTEIFAIFITLFTFISVNVQIFTRVSDFMSAVGFMVLMTTCSIILVSFLFIVARLQNNLKLFIPLGIALLLLIVFGSLSIGGYWNPKFNNPLQEDKIELHVR
jgi:hypothetical protein